MNENNISVGGRISEQQSSEYDVTVLLVLRKCTLFIKTTGKNGESVEFASTANENVSTNQQKRRALTKI